MKTRPWGWFIKLIDLNFFWIKLIRVNTRTSLQYHQYRTELHISKYGLQLYMPLERHRMASGTFLEIAWGKVAEDDIIRLEDDYGRA